MTRSTVHQTLLAGGLLLLPNLGFTAEAFHFDHGRPLPFITAPALIALIIGMALFFIYKRDKRRQDLIEKFIERGQEIPPPLLPQPPSRQRELRRGVWFTSLGVGWFLVLFLATDDARISAAWSVILLFLGAASFINAALFHRSPAPRQ